MPNTKKPKDEIKVNAGVSVARGQKAKMKKIAKKRGYANLSQYTSRLYAEIIEEDARQSGRPLPDGKTPPPKRKPRVRKVSSKRKP